MKNRVWMVFNNGDIWEAIKISGSACCGKRINIAYIDRQIP